MTHSLLFDETIELVNGEYENGTYSYHVQAGSSFGEPQPVEVAINSLLRDGALTRTDRDENREVSLVVTIRATDGYALDQGIARLKRATQKRTTLVWTPPDGYARPHVFEVETSSLHNPSDFDDLAWVANRQTFRLRLVCLPYWRAETLTTDVAEGIPSVGTVVNNGETLPGWSTPAATVQDIDSQGRAVPRSYTAVDPQPADMLQVDATKFVEGAGSMAVKGYRVRQGVSADTLYNQVENFAELTQAITIPSGGYLSFAVKLEAKASYWTRTETNDYFGYTWQNGNVLHEFGITSAEHGRQVWYNDTNSNEKLYYKSLRRNFIVEALADGWVRYTLRVTEPLTISKLDWYGYHFVPAPPDSYEVAGNNTYRYLTFETTERPRMWVDQVAVAETATLGRQVLKTITVDGSARTTGAIHVAAPSDSVPLGQVLAFTIPQSKIPAGFKPDLRQWVLPGASTTPDAEATNGSYFADITSTYGSPAESPKFEVPAAQFINGPYQVIARIKHFTSNNTYTFGLRAQLVIDGVDVGSPTLIERDYQVPGPFPSPSKYRMIIIDTGYLPPVKIASPSLDAIVRFDVKGNGLDLDEIYLLPAEGDLTLVDCGTGVAASSEASSHLWIDSPSTNQPQGAFWRGTSPDRSNALSAWSVTTVPGLHVFEPGEMLAFVASTDAQGPTVTFDYHERNF